MHGSEKVLALGCCTHIDDLQPASWVTFMLFAESSLLSTGRAGKQQQSVSVHLCTTPVACTTSVHCCKVRRGVLKQSAALQRQPVTSQPLSADSLQQPRHRADPVTSVIKTTFLMIK